MVFVVFCVKSTLWFWYDVTAMKAVSEKTWVQKAVFFEPKPLFSSALTMWRRGWYLCMELRIICMGGGFEKVWLTDPSCFPKPNTGPCWDQVESRHYFRWIIQISWTAQIPELDGAYSHPYRSTNLKEKVNPSFPPRQEPRLKQKKREIMWSPLK